MEYTLVMKIPVNASAIRAGVAMITVACCSIVASRESLAAEHVIHISVDGLRPSYLQALVDGGLAPNFKRFQDEGAWTNNGRTDFTHTTTLPNHTSMLTGRPVSQPAGMPNDVHHGYTSNGDPDPGETLHNSGNLNAGYIASTFDVVHDAGLSTALFASKSKFSLFDVSYDADSGSEHPNGRDKIDDSFAAQDDTLPYSATMQERLLAELAERHFNSAFVHYSDPDVAGHDSGWGSLPWIQALLAVDQYLGEVFALVDSDATLSGRTAILLTADHGGSGAGHRRQLRQRTSRSRCTPGASESLRETSISSTSIRVPTRLRRAPTTVPPRSRSAMAIREIWHSHCLDYRQFPAR